MAIKDLTTGRVYSTRAFRERHGAQFAKQGIDLRAPFINEGDWLGALCAATLDDEAAEAVLAYLKALTPPGTEPNDD